MIVVLCSSEWSAQANEAARSARRANQLAIVVDFPRIEADFCIACSITVDEAAHLETVVRGPEELKTAPSPSMGSFLVEALKINHWIDYYD